MRFANVFLRAPTMRGPLPCPPCCPTVVCSSTPRVRPSSLLRVDQELEPGLARTDVHGHRVLAEVPLGGPDPGLGTPHRRLGL